MKLGLSLLLTFVSVSFFAQVSPEYDTTLLVSQPLDTNRIFSTSEVMQQPEFPGGTHNFLKFLNNNLIYPKTCMENGFQGKVYLQFVVERDGTLSDIELKRGVSECKSLDDEAIRLVKLMPNWIPASVDNKPVRVRYILPISFKIN